MYTNNKLAKSIRLALMFGAASMAFSGTAAAQNQEEEPVEELEEEVQERIQVTGSRIRRTDMEGAVPVTVIDREAIDLSGDMSVSDIIRNTTFNSAGSFRPQSGSSAQGVSQVSLRGLGASRTLVLVDGRRLTMSPSTGSSQDLNSIPIGAVERIEILSDGASAIYGSDAIGGVINVITRKDYNGAQLTLGEGEVSVPSEGGDREQGSILFGSSDAKTSLLGGVSWNKREIVYENAYPWVQPGASIFGANFFAVEDTYAFQGIPGACAEDNFYIDGGLCRYNFNATNANEASSANESLFLKGTHQINNDWMFYANASVAETVSFGRYAPVPDSNFYYGDALTTPADSFNNPTNPDAWFYDPNNPDAVAYDPAIGDNAPVYLWHRFAAVGNRDSTVTNKSEDLLVGFEGMIGDQAIDFGYRRVRNNTADIGRGYLAANFAWDSINNFNPGYCEDGTFDAASCRTGYNIQSPSSNPEQVLAGSNVTISRISDFDIDEYYANTAFDVMSTDAGMIQGFLGFEHRQERYSDQYDSQSEAGLVGGSAGNSAGGTRQVNAAFFEVLVPVTYDFELNFAGRYDSYSDFGSNFAPKVSFKWSVTEDIIWRGSWGQGFRAPSLDILTQKTSFSADSVNDPTTCTLLAGDPAKPCQISAYYQANADLGAEESDQISTGLAMNVTEQISFAIDYYDIEITNRIRQFGSQALINRELAGDPVPAGLGVIRNADGVITRINAGYGNEGTLETSGLDFNLRANWDFGSMGALSQNLQVSHVLDYKIDGGRDTVGDLGFPQQRANFNNDYSFGDWTFAYNLNYIGDTARETIAGVQLGSVGSWVTHDFQVNYATQWDSQLTLGVQNAFEKLPELVPYGGRDYNYNLYNGWGRVFYVRFQQNF
ncbi:TonB-dependent receptor [Pseudidiomarina salinarum]|uniref:TonB-dependent receptor n=1 Tax=Pseudidiomarina salinarum TaxID=435908 RepID=A0A094IUN8_9GAMM|nr:TonB-dependent receptor [Pseudidiomarina salinarum]KFZ31385.1 TonB-dependent receptor [Pseudidiomarina salinarum]RUO70855.1 TonB-dependent receptor [Pseudidiomarina salinarum]